MFIWFFPFAFAYVYLYKNQTTIVAQNASPHMSIILWYEMHIVFAAVYWVDLVSFVVKIKKKWSWKKLSLFTVLHFCCCSCLCLLFCSLVCTRCMCGVVCALALGLLLYSYNSNKNPLCVKINSIYVLYLLWAGRCKFFYIVISSCLRFCYFFSQHLSTWLLFKKYCLFLFAWYSNSCIRRTHI